MGPFDPRLLARAGPARRLLALDAVAGVVRTLLLLLQVTLIATVVATVVTDGEPPGAGVVVALLLVIAARALLAQQVERLGREAAVTVQSSLRSELVTTRLSRPGGTIGRWSPAELATAAVDGVDGLEVYFGRYLPQVVLAVVVPVAVIGWTALVDLESAAVMVVTVPLVPVFMWLIGRSADSRARANLDALVRLSAHFLDLIRGLPTLRAFGRGRAQVDKLHESADTYRRTTMSTLRLAFLSGLVLDLATTISIALVAVTLGVRLVGGSVELRPALTVLLLVPELYAPMRQVGTLFHASADGLAGAHRMLDALEDSASRPGLSADARPPELVPGRPPRIELRHATVAFEDRDHAALDGVDLTIAPGEVVAVVGPSGAGKTTLGRVVLGLQPLDAGQVLADGSPIDGYADTWRGRVAWAAQRPALVHGTITHNLALGLGLDVSRDELRRAAALAGAASFIEALPDGYETVVGPAGRGLSAGQRQRLGLARALLRPVPVLVLDEPTANLDRAAARQVAAAVEARRGHQSVLVLTHDQDLVGGADRAITLVAGRVTDAGSALLPEPAT